MSRNDSPHDDVIKWKHFPCYCSFLRGIHRSPVVSPHKGQWRGALICVSTKGWANNQDAGDLRRHRKLLWRHRHDTILTNISYLTREGVFWACKRHNQSMLFGDRLSIKMSSYHYRDPHVKVKTVSRPSYLSHGNPHTRERMSLYWGVAHVVIVHDDVIKRKHFPRNWPFVRGIHREPVNSRHKGQWRGALMFSLICVWINDWVNNREAGDLRRYCAHYHIIVMHHLVISNIISHIDLYNNGTRPCFHNLSNQEIWVIYQSHVILIYH